MEEKKENIINFDFQGWPEFKMSMKDIIERIGGKLNEETNKWEIPNDGWLTQCPTILHDDGMGYGVNPEYIIDVDVDKIAQTCNVWADKQLDNARVYAELGVYPGAVVNINGTEYTIEDVIVEDQEKCKVKIQAAVWDFQALEKAHKNKKKYNPKRELFDPEVIEKAVKDEN